MGHEAHRSNVAPIIRNKKSMRTFILKGGKIMHFLEIAGEKYGNDDLSRITANGLAGLGIESFQTIEIDTRKSSIAISFDEVEDTAIVQAIAGVSQQNSGKEFSSDNVSQFILELYSIYTILDNSV
jgi:hypothetical protein